MRECLRYGEEPELQDVLDDPMVRQLMATDGADWDYILPSLACEPAAARHGRHPRKEH